jgi:hypothetical protein
LKNIFIYSKFKKRKFLFKKMGIGDWDWGLGIGDWVNNLKNIKYYNIFFLFNN